MADKQGANVSIWYVNGDGGNDGITGDSVANAWGTIQYAFDKIADGTVNDGDEIRICKTSDDATNYLISTTLDPAWNNKEVIITGANSGGGVDNTQVEIRGNVGGAAAILDIATGEAERTVWAHLHFNANDNSQTCVKSGSANQYMKWVNCRFSQATENGVEWTGANTWDFLNCRFDNNAQHGLEMDSTSYGIAYKCLFDNNGAMGVDTAALNAFRHKWIECVFYNNGTEGMDWTGAGGFVANCIFDSNGSDGLLDRANSVQSLRIGNIYSNNAHAGVNYITSTDSVAFNELFYNNRNDTEDNSGGSDAISELGHMINYVPGASGENPNYVDAANFDFTPGPTFGGVGAGIPTQYQWFGSTADDIGLNKWIKTETISVF